MVEGSRWVEGVVKVRRRSENLCEKREIWRKEEEWDENGEILREFG